MSPGMLNQARKKGVYKDLHQMVMGETPAEQVLEGADRIANALESMA